MSFARLQKKLDNRPNCKTCEWREGQNEKDFGCANYEEEFFGSCRLREEWFKDFVEAFGELQQKLRDIKNEGYHSSAKHLAKELLEESK